MKLTCISSTCALSRGVPSRTGPSSLCGYCVMLPSLDGWCVMGDCLPEYPGRASSASNTGRICDFFVRVRRSGRRYGLSVCVFEQASQNNMKSTAGNRRVHECIKRRIYQTSIQRGVPSITTINSTRSCHYMCACACVGDTVGDGSGEVGWYPSTCRMFSLTRVPHGSSSRLSCSRDVRNSTPPISTSTSADTGSFANRSNSSSASEHSSLRW